jgi:hypothetical protein
MLIGSIVLVVMVLGSGSATARKPAARRMIGIMVLVRFTARKPAAQWMRHCSHAIQMTRYAHSIVWSRWHDTNLKNSCVMCPELS